MKASQVQFGRDRIQKIASAWGITVRQAARVLQGREFKAFWQWEYADEFLIMNLYEEVSTTDITGGGPRRYV